MDLSKVVVTYKVRQKENVMTMMNSEMFNIGHNINQIMKSLELGAFESDHLLRSRNFGQHSKHIVYLRVM